MPQLPVRRRVLWVGLSLWVVAVLFYCVEWLQRVAPTLLVSPMMHHYGLSASVIAAAFSLYYWVYAVMQLPAGFFLDTYGPRKMLTLAALLVTLGTLLYLGSTSLIGLCVARVLVGLGSSFAFIGCLKIARLHMSSSAFPVLVSLTNSVGMLGALLGMTPLSAMIARWGWQRSLLFASAVSFVMMILLWFALKPAEKQAARLPTVHWREQLMGLLLVAKHPLLWLIGLYAGLMQVPVIAYAELWAVPFLHDYDHLNMVQAALVNSYVFWGIFVGGFVWGFLMGLPMFGRRGDCKRRRYVCLLVAHVGVFACLYLLFFQVHTRLWTLEELNFGLGFFTVVMLISYTWAADLVPKSLTASAIAMVNMVGVIIGALFQWILGLFIEHMHAISQYEYALMPMLATSTLAFMLAMWIVWQFALRKKVR